MKAKDHTASCTHCLRLCKQQPGPPKASGTQLSGRNTHTTDATDIAGHSGDQQQRTARRADPHHHNTPEMYALPPGPETFPGVPDCPPQKVRLDQTWPTNNGPLRAQLTDKVHVIQQIKSYLLFRYHNHSTRGQHVRPRSASNHQSRPGRQNAGLSEAPQGPVYENQHSVTPTTWGLRKIHYRSGINVHQIVRQTQRIPQLSHRHVQCRRNPRPAQQHTRNRILNKLRAVRNRPHQQDCRKLIRSHHCLLDS